MIIKFDDEKQTAQVSLKALEILNQLQEKELRDPTGVKSLWRPEYAAYMVEGTPGKRMYRREQLIIKTVNLIKKFQINLLQHTEVF